MPPVRWLVDGLIKDRGVAMLYGETGTMKSYSTIDLACRMVNGMTFHGRRMTQGEVVYIVGEAEDEAKERIDSWTRYYGLTEPEQRPLLQPWAMDITSTQQMATLTELVNGFGGSIKLIIFDTLSDCTAGLRLNDPDEVGERLKPAILSLARATRAAVLMVHHTGHNQYHERGARILRDMTDTTIRVSKQRNNVRWKIEKLRRAQAGTELNFRVVDVSRQVDMDNMALLLPIHDDEVEEKAPTPPSKTNAELLTEYVILHPGVPFKDAARALGWFNTTTEKATSSYYAAIGQADVLKDEGRLYPLDPGAAV